MFKEHLSYKLLFIFLLTFPITSASQSRSHEEQIDSLLSEMTIYEKIGQMTQLNITTINTTKKQRDVVLDEEKARKLIREHHIGSFLNGEAVPAEQWFTYMDKLTRIAVEESRLNIPIIYGIDHMHGASYLKGATIFPHNLNIGNTFDTTFAWQTGRITAIESAALGHHWNFAPVLDLARTPYWPRYYETFGEDPVLSAKMGAAYVGGQQMNHKEIAPYKMASTAKHFLGYSDPKSGWDRSPAELSDQTIHEFHRPSFQAAVDAGLKTVMVNSGEINGVPVHGSRKLLTGLLREKMEFDGVILTDWADIDKMVDFHHVAPNFKEATYRAITAGIDMSMTPNDLDFNTALKELVEEGRITEERLDESVRRILKLKFDLGLFDHPYPSNEFTDLIGSKKHVSIAREAARESIVLLKNKNKVFPIKEDRKIVVTGPLADSKRALGGGWTLAWQGGHEDQYPEDMHTILSALETTFGKKNVVHLSIKKLKKNPKLFKKHDIVLYVGGEEPYTEFVGNITDPNLPGTQNEELAFLTDQNIKTGLILIEGRPRIIKKKVLKKLNGIIFAGLPGFEGADAVADILSGEVNPSGKLSFSYPKNVGHQVPYNHKSSDVYFFNSDEANNIVQEYQSISLFPFGTGLSYTTFEYSDLKLSTEKLTKNGKLKAEITITNTGDVSGKESVLWFIEDKVGYITRPVKELQHFEKIRLEPGESKTLTFTIIPENHLGYPDENGNLILETGNFELMVGDQKKIFTLTN
jgi:beta-glucosidase